MRECSSDPALLLLLSEALLTATPTPAASGGAPATKRELQPARKRAAASAAKRPAERPPLGSRMRVPLSTVIISRRPKARLQPESRSGLPGLSFPRLCPVHARDAGRASRSA